MMRKVKQFLFNQNRDTIIFFNVDTKEKKTKNIAKECSQKKSETFCLST